MNKLKRFGLLMAMAVMGVMVRAQEVAANTNADTGNIMKSNGKIYVVMAVVIVIVLGLFLYLFNLDRKVSKLEKK